jgi:lactate dehydrogenase-like 2-hydroxyacid dehydrogenase
VGKVGQRMAEAAKGINPEIAPEEVKEEVKQATAEVVEKAPSLYTLYAMAATLLLALTFLVIGLSGNPLSYAPIPYVVP